MRTGTAALRSMLWATALGMPLALTAASAAEEKCPAAGGPATGAIGRREAAGRSRQARPDRRAAGKNPRNRRQPGRAAHGPARPAAESAAGGIEIAGFRS